MIKDCKIYALVVAGGKGLRMKSKVRKQYIQISGIPMLTRTIAIFSNHSLISHIVVVIPKEDIDYCLENVISPSSFNKRISVVAGGSERQQSVMNGLKKLIEYDNPKLRHINKDTINIDNDAVNKEKTAIHKDKNRIVLIHDGVRPFVDSDIINGTIEGALKYGACIPVVPVADTLKLMDSNEFVDKIVDRTNLYQVQTPQAFELDLIIKAHEDAALSNFFATDDASLVERLGKKVFMTQGSKKNIKITTKEDLLFAEHLSKIR